MTVLLATAQLMIILIICIYELKRKSASVFLWATSFIMFGIMHFIMVLKESDEYPVWVFNNASLFVIGFCSIYLLTRLLLVRNSQVIHIDTGAIMTLLKEKKSSLNIADKKFIKLLLLLLMTIVAYNTFTLIKAAGGVFDSSWGSYYNYYSREGYISISKVINLFFLPCASIFFIAMGCKNKKLSIISGVIIFLYVIISRNKADLLPVLSGIIAFFVYKKGSLNFKSIFTFLFLGCISIYVVYSFQVYRNTGSIKDFISTFSFIDFNALIFERIISAEGELGLLRVFYHFIYHNNNFPDFGEGHTYLRMLLVFIPTSFSLGIKPTDFAISMGSAWTMDFSNTTFSTHPTFFGDAFANLGYFGILLGIFWALLVWIIDRIIDRKNFLVKLALINLITSNYVLVGRGSVYNSFTSIVHGIIIICFFYFITRIRLKVPPIVNK